MAEVYYEVKSFGVGLKILRTQSKKKKVTKGGRKEGRIRKMNQKV